MSNNFEVDRITEYYNVAFPGPVIHGGHSHSDYELNYILEGQLEVVYEDRAYSLKAGDVFIGEPVGFHSNSIKLGKYTEFISVHFTANFDTPSEQSYVYTLTENERKIADIIVNDLTEAKTENGKFSKSNPVYDITIKLFYVLIAKLQSRTQQVHFAKTKEAVIYNTAVHYMKNNIDKTLKIDDIARKCSVCRTTLKKVFSNYTNMGVANFFLNLKLKEAMKMLVSGMSIDEVSEQLGFSSQAYFSNCFKRELGITPIKYKKENGM